MSGTAPERTTAMSGEDHRWATWPWQRCRAYREWREFEEITGDYGRCELRRGHDGDHALERGFQTPTWSTDWTDCGRP